MKKILLIIIIFSFCNEIWAQGNIWTWVGSNDPDDPLKDNLWSNPNDWDDGLGTPGTPIAGDFVVFDANGENVNCTIDQNTGQLVSFSVLSGYTGTITQSSTTVNATTFIIESGTFVSQSTFNISDSFTQSGGTFSTSSAFTVNSIFTLSGGSFTSSSALTIGSTGSTSGQFNVLDGTFMGGGQITVNGSFTQSGGIFNAPVTNNVRINNDFNYTGGTLNPGTGTFLFYNNSFTLRGSPTFYNLTFANSSNTGGVTFTIENLITVTNILTLNTGTLVGLRPITLNRGVVDGEGIINVAGNIILIGHATGAPTTGGGTATIRLNGTSTQTITGRTVLGQMPLPNLEINSTSPRSIGFGASNQSITVAGNFTTSGTARFSINTGTIAVQGDVTLGNSGIAQAVGAGTGTVLLNNRLLLQTIRGNNTYGSSALPNLTIDKDSAPLTFLQSISLTGTLNYINSGTITNTGSSIVYSGPDGQEVLSPSGNFPPYYTLVVAGTGTEEKTVSGPLTSTNYLILANADLNLGANTLRILNNSAGGITRFYNDDKIIGNVERAVTVGETYSYPVGTSGGPVQRLDITFTNTGVDNTYVSVNYTNTAPTGDVSPASSDPTVTYDGFASTGFWTINGSGDGDVNPVYDIRIFPAGLVEEVGKAYSFLKRHDATEDWQLLGSAYNPATVGDDGNVEGDQIWADGSIRRNNVTGFSEGAIGSGNIEPTPVELHHFDATLIKDHVLIDWATLSETKSSHFIIERSEQADHFAAIGKIESAGFSSERINYSFKDASASSSKSDILYYRLRQVDVDGVFKIYPIKAVNLLNIQRGPKIAVHPNPASTSVTISSRYDHVVTLQVFNSVGKLIAEEKIENEKKLINTSNYKQGVYYFKFNTGLTILNERVIIK